MLEKNSIFITDLKILSEIETASSPDILITLIPPEPKGVEIAAIVLFILILPFITIIYTIFPFSII